MKKLLLLVVMALSCLSSFGYNNGDKFTKDGITYQVTDNVNFVVKTFSANASAVAADGSLTVPATVHDPKDDAYVYKVSEARFYSNGTLPKSVNKLIISDGVETLASLYTNTQVTSIVIPKSLKEFTGLNLTDVREFIVDSENPYFKFIYSDRTKDSQAGYLASKDGKIYYYRVYPTADNFYQSTNGVIVIPDDVEEIKSYVYAKTPDNTGGNTIHVGKSVAKYGTSSSSSEQIVAFTCDSENTTFHAENGVLYKKIDSSNKYELHAYPLGKKDAVFTVWDECTKLNTTSFEFLYYMKVIKLNKVETVAENAFRLNYLHTVVFTDSQKEFTNSQHSHQTTFVFEDMIENIAVSGTEKAPVVTLTLKDGWDYDRSHSNFHIVDGMLFSTDEKTIVAAPCLRHADEEWTIPSGVTTIKRYAFEYTRIKKFISNPELTSIGSLAFQYCYVEEFDFSASSGLKSITGFHGSNKLTKVTLSPASQSIAGFTQCTSLEEIHVPDGSQLVKIENGTFSELKSLKRFVFDGTAPNFTTVGSKAFYECTNLTYINLPPTTTTIGESAFSGCTNLNTVEFVVDPTSGTADITTIKANAFADSGITSIVIPEGVTTIEREAFKDCNVLESVTIPSTVTSISAEAFKYCTNLKEITVDKDNSVYSSVDGFLLTKDKETLCLFPPGKANDKFTLLPPSITKIGDYSFYCCVNLKNVTIPNKVTTIGDRAFGLCSNLNTITFLCDDMIDPAKIDQRLNHNAFDDDMFANIDINVRQSLYNTYKTENTFYNKFKSISPSFRINSKNEYIAVSDNAVDLLDVKETDWTYVVPSSITDADGKEWSVALMGDYACQNAPTSIKELVTFDNVEYIGANAFKQTGTQSIESIFFVQKYPTKQLLSTTRFELTPDDLGPSSEKVYKEFAEGTKIYVRKSAYETCLEDWAAYKNHLNYQIPGISITSEFGSFSREFDVDLSDVNEVEGENVSTNWDTDKNKPKVIAYTTKIKNIEVGGNVIGIGVKSINCVAKGTTNYDGDGDGTYIPKNTGVLLQAIDGTSPTGFYYRIGEREEDFSAPTDNIMMPVVNNPTTISAKEKDSDGSYFYNYIISGGTYKYLTKDKEIPIHKSYLHVKGIENTTSGETKTLRLIFDDDENESTAINAVTDNAEGEAVVYDLSGRRLQQIGKAGMYIVNGKKVIVK